MVELVEKPVEIDVNKEIVLNDVISVFDKMEDGFRKVFDRATPDIRRMSEKELLNKIENTTRVHIDKVEMIRTAFWNDYNEAVMNGRYMMQNKIYKDICSCDTFREYMLNPYITSYIIIPPVKYEIELDTLLRVSAYPKLKEILNLNAIRKVTSFDEDTGEIRESEIVNVNLLKLQVQVIKQIEDRIKGMSVQRVQTSETKDINVHMSGIDMKTLDRKIMEIEGKLGKINDEANVKKALGYTEPEEGEIV